MIAAIIEMDAERDRKECVKLYQQSEMGNRALAEWLLKHFQYSGAEVARWVGCEESKIQRLRRWARAGFKDATPNPRKNRKPAPVPDEPLESLENSNPYENDEDNMLADGETRLSRIDICLDIIGGAGDKTRLLSRHLNQSLTSEDIAAIILGIEALLNKWSKIKQRLERRNA